MLKKLETVVVPLVEETPVISDIPGRLLYGIMKLYGVYGVNNLNMEYIQYTVVILPSWAFSLSLLSKHYATARLQLSAEIITEKAIRKGFIVVFDIC